MTNRVSKGVLNISSEAPMNLMQFRGVRITPDNKVLDLLNILNEYRRTCEQEGRHLDAKKARRRYAELKTKEEKRHERNLKILHDQEMADFGKFCMLIK